MVEANQALGYALALTALIALPCHLVLSLPLALTVLGRTAFGATLAVHTGLLGAAIYLPDHSSIERPPYSWQEYGAHAHTPSLPVRGSRSGADR